MCDAVVAAIADATVFQMDEIMELEAITALKGDGEFGKVYDLLCIFATGDLEAFDKFYAADSAAIDKLGQATHAGACMLANQDRWVHFCTDFSVQEEGSHKVLGIASEVSQHLIA